MRTAALDGAHAEYFRGIRNPIAVKVGPTVEPDELLRMIDAIKSGSLGAFIPFDRDGEPVVLQ